MTVGRAELRSAIRTAAAGAVAGWARVVAVDGGGVQIEETVEPCERHWVTTQTIVRGLRRTRRNDFSWYEAGDAQVVDELVRAGLGLGKRSSAAR
ncbi:hypothetical protein P0W64_21170 [Tsukamurella sp. 8F]|uniref:hypothetical protein n=1 Tax=unclassified Tsukamurella TaxID=2633480 RepID=UPI0023B8E5EC|nr:MULTISPECIES: hypothetical protein [unclassified Tsukamurella]MDF0532269.1 hypothetical protein [Tsukamurella sp. 8J]MDF0589295.1 hypothetical protein [Tsukamurella sp. 8F]